MIVDVVISCAAVRIGHDISLQYNIEAHNLFIKILCAISIYFHDNKLKSSSINIPAKSFILFIFIENIVDLGEPLIFIILR